MSLKNIGIGWGRWLGLLDIPKEVKEESERRLKICEGCEFAQTSKFLELIGDTNEHVEAKYCTQCSCPCHQKSLTDDKCPLDKWEK